MIAQGSGHGLWRSRWAAIGAAVAVALGAGGLFVASATGGAESNFVAVTPVRVVDSRIDVGMTGALVAAQSVVVQITGSIPTTTGSSIVVPANATAVVVNVTAVQPTSAGFMSVRPGDATGVPATSTLNFSSGLVVANSQTVQLPVAGNLQVHYGANSGAVSGATVDLLIDVVGYYVADDAPDPGPASAQFYALMPGDNAAPVAAGGDVDFPQNGPNANPSVIARATDDSFTLATIGLYRISFQVSVTEAGQLILTLDGADLAYTVVGRATGTSQISGTALVETTSVNSILTVRNPSGNPTALTIAPIAGGFRSVSATLLIELLSRAVGDV